MTKHPNGSPRRVVIVDADRRVRQSLTSILELEPGVEVVGAAPDIQEGLKLVEALAPDVVAVDPCLPEVPAGLALVATLRRRAPGMRIVVMSCQALEEQAIADGADAFVAKDGAASEFVAALLARDTPFARLGAAEPAPTDPQSFASVPPSAT